MFISHLDMMRAWERVFRRAGVPLDYTKGYTPHPRLAVASPLPVGFTSSGELMDIWVRKWLPPDAAYMSVTVQLPQGFSLETVEEVPETLGSLQSKVCAARYLCGARHPGGIEEVRRSLSSFLESESYPYEYARGDQMRSVDLRPFVLSLDADEENEAMWAVSLHVRHGQSGSIRPDHLLEALGFITPPEYIHRTELTIQP
ncbi:MAG: TIGR03936 family radical SAM-associated protein [Chloroflexota bacterium]